VTALTAASQIDLPVYRLASLRKATVAKGDLSLSWGVHVTAGLHITKVSFSGGGLTSTSTPSYPDPAWYGIPVDIGSVSGDYRLENFLRSLLKSRQLELSVEWEARVAELWETALDAGNWATTRVMVDDASLPARALTIGGRVFARAVLPWGDLTLTTTARLGATLGPLTQMTVSELQPGVDAHIQAY
jgi:hypothetical protein